MVSNHVFQNTISGFKNITRKDFDVIELEGKIVASTKEGAIGTYMDAIISAFVQSPAESQVIAGVQYFKVVNNGMAECIVSVEGEDEESYRLGKILAFQIQNLLVAYKERYDKDNFIKSLLLDNLLLVDIYSRSKKLKIENETDRVVFLIETAIDLELTVIEIVKNIFPDKNKNFVTSVDENSIILAKNLQEGETKEDLERMGKEICDTLATEAMLDVRVAIGTIAKELREVSKSYKEAKIALEVGKIFAPDKRIIFYEFLGIGRLIYQLPIQLCTMFLNEVLPHMTTDVLDEEILTTVNSFFENSLNVSETARKIYIHRNTLVYRLDKLQKITGLDVRNFDDAIIFKIILMVSNYMKHMDADVY